HAVEATGITEEAVNDRLRRRFITQLFEPARSARPTARRIDDEVGTQLLIRTARTACAAQHSAHAAATPGCGQKLQGLSLFEYPHTRVVREAAAHVQVEERAREADDMQVGREARAPALGREPG